MENKRWHQEQNTELSRLALQMALTMHQGYDAQQPPEYIEAQRGFLWAMHVLAEHDKFEPPEYGDHRNC